MIKKITGKNFRRYGRMIEYPDQHRKSRTVNLFCIVVCELKTRGCRIAYLVLRDRFIKKLEMHPFSLESFEPVRGKSLLFVSKKRDPKEIECFYLDRPVVLKKGIWHGVISLTRESEIKLTENAKVKCVYWPLDFRLSASQQQ